MAQPSIHIPDELLDRIDDQLEGVKSRSSWIREAAEEKLDDSSNEKGAA